jgi:urease accessory protein
VAHHVRGGPPATLSTYVRVGRDARLVWLGEPLIAAAGCRVERSTRVDLAPGAVALLREALVLGRDGEEPGEARAHTRITLEGRPVVEETLETSPAWVLWSPVVAGPEARMIDALTLAGRRDLDAPPGAMQAHEPATLWRSAGPARSSAGSALAERWRALALEQESARALEDAPGTLENSAPSRHHGIRSRRL